MNIKTISHIQIYLAGGNIPEPLYPESVGEAMEFAVNKVLNGRTKAKMVQTIEIFPMPSLNEDD